MADLCPITVARFWSKVELPVHGKHRERDCWIWKSTRHGKGYGHFSLTGQGGSIAKAHRVAYEIVHGPIPAGMYVCHRCDNPACVNPHHLWLGTNDDNLKDRQNKERQARGERSGRTLMTSEAVREIRLSPPDDIGWARRLGVSKSTVRCARIGRSWRHHPTPPQPRTMQREDGA